jgi:hypothetical protein
MLDTAKTLLKTEELAAVGSSKKTGMKKGGQQQYNRPKTKSKNRLF